MTCTNCLVVYKWPKWTRYHTLKKEYNHILKLTEVLEKMPETLFEAEELASTLDSINRHVGQSSDNSQVGILINALVANVQQVRALTTGTSSQPDDKQIQSLNARLDYMQGQLALQRKKLIIRHRTLCEFYIKL